MSLLVPMLLYPFPSDARRTAHDLPRRCFRGALRAPTGTLLAVAESIYILRCKYSPVQTLTGTHVAFVMRTLLLVQKRPTRTGQEVSNRTQTHTRTPRPHETHLPTVIIIRYGIRPCHSKPKLTFHAVPRKALPVPNHQPQLRRCRTSHSSQSPKCESIRLYMKVHLCRHTAGCNLQPAVTRQATTLFTATPLRAVGAGASDCNWHLLTPASSDTDDNGCKYTGPHNTTACTVLALHTSALGRPRKALLRGEDYADGQG